MVYSTEKPPLSRLVFVQPDDRPAVFRLYRRVAVAEALGAIKDRLNDHLARGADIAPFVAAFYRGQPLMERSGVVKLARDFYLARRIGKAPLAALLDGGIAVLLKWLRVLEASLARLAADKEHHVSIFLHKNSVLADAAAQFVRFDPVILMFFIFFQIHYFQRAFVFPLLLTGKSKMPLAIMSMGILFNLLNGYMQGQWIFHLAPEGMYGIDWFMSPWFILGTLLFFTGMLVNWHSDYIIRHLRKPGDTRHYLPQKGMYRYVTSANYFGEIVEWAGWAILTCSLSGLVFLWWTIANLVPRANAIWHRYREEFGDEVGNRKRVFPFLY